MYYIFGFRAGGCITACMVQPKTPPISIRPSAALLAEIKAWATDHGLNQHAAILALLALGVRGPVIAEPEPEPETKPATTKEPKAAAKPSKRFVSRLKGEWKAP